MNFMFSQRAAKSSTGASVPPAGPADGLPQPARRRAMTVVIMGLTLAVLDTSLLNLALPDIGRELRSDAAASVWVVNAYQLAVLVVMLPLAALGERLGYRRVYRAGMVVFVLASVGAMSARSMETLIAARALQGIGASGMMAVNSALVRLIYPRAELGRGMALNSIVVASASMAGPSIAAVVLSLGSWPWLFAVNLPITAYAWLRARTALPDNPPAAAPQPAFSLLDFTLNGAMFALLFLGGSLVGARSGSMAGHAGLGALLLVGALVIGAVHVRRQSARAAPLLPVDLLRIPIFALSMASSISAFCAQMLGMLSLPFLLLEVYGRSHLAAGILITAWPLAIALTAPISGRLVGRYHAGLLGGLGMIVLASGLALLALLPPAPADWDIVWRMLLCGVGFAIFQTPNNHTIVTSAPLHRSGAASGMLGTARNTGQTLGAVVLGTLFALHPRHDGSTEALALGIGAGFALLAALTSSLRART